MHLSAQRGFRCDLCLCAICDPLPIAVGIPPIHAQKRRANGARWVWDWATPGPRLGHPWATLGPPLGRMKKVLLFAAKDGKGRVGVLESP
jgi:hypothetical protein